MLGRAEAGIVLNRKRHGAMWRETGRFTKMTRPRNPAPDNGESTLMCECNHLKKEYLTFRCKCLHLINGESNFRCKCTHLIKGCKTFGCKCIYQLNRESNFRCKCLTKGSCNCNPGSECSWMPYELSCTQKVAWVVFKDPWCHLSLFMEIHMTKGKQ